ncbi:DUF1178 family protein [Halodurantibacterium flavum]|uniref:DUF1178 family protein n=1 Tax=Halodurantibacterium flavum TaxID=1382802 RepID=A0ABW4S7L5_9RHOB
MIRFTLKCANDHAFESWFQSGNAFDTLRSQGQLTCPSCGSIRVDKALMAPAVSTSEKVPPAEAGPLPVPAPDPRQEALAALRRHIEANSDYVGMNFAAEARAMHSGEAPSRPIHGEAKLEEAKALLEEGVPVAPLPFLPQRKLN